MGTSDPHHVPNLVDGKWDTKSSSHIMSIPNPLHKNSKPIFTLTDTKVNELDAFVKSMERVPKSGVHNPLKNVERYLHLGDVTRRAGEELLKPEVAEFFTKSIQKCVPKSHAQAMGEVTVTAAFLLNFSSDNVRFLARGFTNPGDHAGQSTTGYRWPYGPVSIITPFNFPLEIPVLQLMGALFMGNKPVLKPAEKCAVVMEQFLRLLHEVGLEKADVDFLNGEGVVMAELLKRAPIRLTQFTGSSRVGEILSEQTRGKVKVEDAGFDWKIIGPDVDEVDYVAWQCDQDTYASVGQKCSAQSILFMHENYQEAGLLDKIKHLAEARKLEDLTVGPVLTHTTEDILGHCEALLKIPGSYTVCGGKELTGHDIPEIYGAVEPTAVFVPLEEMMKEENFDLCTREIFAPFQVITSYNDSSLPLVIEACERMSHHLTAAVVSNDIKFQHHVLSNTVNGTTYVGRRARTTGAPQNHWFGPAGDTRGAGIGTREAIRLVWSCHREIVTDEIVPEGWVQPKAT
eukprot:CAMPEP_0172514100 /NCGR_PEP_ID=MMETSP1066-20121228/257417_1 /TAXON_ID=671091 /ORGANISM="Coscinodiscus wailesii, Strain CCMP2513" /LENGTH=514 /DNA_ID=CAMNT_0013294631 /DNA_START=196 /DNA_END=1740 /DNA_ORIENTATION=+